MNVLKLSSLSKRFGEELLFRDLSFQFPKTGLFILCGGSGSGKTTLLRMIAGLDTDYEGEIEGGGLERVSYVFQEHRLLPSLTALDNVALILSGPLREEENRKKAALLLTEVGYPEEDLLKKPHQLSGGMKQRVSLARALAAARPILLLDEPEKDLDPSLKERLLRLIQRKSTEALVVLVSHTPELYHEILSGTLSLS